jgi:EmrB/QacA subfamily drug resistance transporter
MTAPRRKPANAAPRSPVKKSSSGPPARKAPPTPATRTVRKSPTQDSGDEVPPNPWNALWAMLVGFFMILVDSTIVSVANPTIMDKLQTDYDAIIWVTSAYLLAYAVPLLVAGRLGDRYGPKNLYIVGLSVFTLASLWCGLSGSIEMLIAARVVQGIGAALLTPQTLSTITRIFPPERRGVAMSVWGATAGVATLVGPIAGGVLVDHLGWQWIFFVNVPIGVIGLGLAIRLIPALPTNKHHFDWLGVALSGIAMFLVVFGLQEGQSHGWALWIWVLIFGGVLVMAGFVYWQAVNTREPLIPLQIFRDRNFSLANVGTAVIGFAIVALILPVMFYAQAVCGLTPTRAALLTAPMAIASGLPAPFVGKLVDRAPPRPIIGFGFSTLAIALTWLSIEMTPTTPIWRLALPLAAMGFGMAFIFAPLAATATRNLPSHLAGAGSGVFNATRQVGSVLGSAGMAAFMTSRISAEMPGGQARPAGESSVAQLPAFLHAPFSAALSQAMLLPAFVALFGVIAAVFLLGSDKKPVKVAPGPARTIDRSAFTEFDDYRTEVIPIVRDHNVDYAADGYVDDDDGYVEFAVLRESETEPEAEPDVRFGEGDTAPLPTRVEHPRPAPAEAWHSAPVEAWHSLLDDEPKRGSAAEPIGFAHNGFHVDEPEVLRPVSMPVNQARPDPVPDPAVDGFERLAHSIDSWSESFADLFEPHGASDGRPSRHELLDAPQAEAGRRPRHYREDPDDDPGYGRHSSP